ncbi:hypothetical protein E2562_028655 [Oryza meyeriana var. granulata]|uniref:UspA domain-containing protein n=1 Tax=Oryza meyeriana var. granulata TaxID=110450 RepID=A0A6G1BNP0_9ORYZ|nr:hypothetical protein E2562_028655 [Oryza meyeriana var. granulata]
MKWSAGRSRARAPGPMSVRRLAGPRRGVPQLVEALAERAEGKGGEPRVRSGVAASRRGGPAAEDVDEGGGGGSRRRRPRRQRVAEEVEAEADIVEQGGGRRRGGWALSHSVRPCDTVVLLDVVRSAGGKNRDDPSRGRQHLETMRSICQAKRPEVHVELSMVEGKETGPTIVEAARKEGVSLLVMGQKKRSITWRLLMMWMTGGKGSGGTVEYCVQNAACMALAVRRKSRRGGGYLITTRRQRDFWLLA